MDSEIAKEIMENWWWARQCRRPTKAQRSVISYLDRTGERIECSDGRFSISGTWLNPNFYPETGTPRLTAATAISLIRERWVSAGDDSGGEVARTADEPDNVIAVEFRRSKARADSVLTKALYRLSQEVSLGQIAGDPTGAIVIFVGANAPNIGYFGDVRRHHSAIAANALATLVGSFRASLSYSLNDHGRYAAMVAEHFEAERGLVWPENVTAQQDHRDQRRAFLAKVGHPAPQEVL